MNVKDTFLKLANQLRNRRKVALSTERVYMIPMGISQGFDQAAKALIAAQDKIGTQLKQEGEDVFVLGRLAEKLIAKDPALHVAVEEPALARAASLRKATDGRIRYDEVPALQVDDAGNIIFDEADANDFWSPQAIQVALENLFNGGEIASPPAKGWAMNFRLKYLRPWIAEELKGLMGVASELGSFGIIPKRGPSKAEMDITYELERTLREVGEPEAEKMYSELGIPALEEAIEADEDLDLLKAQFKSDIIEAIENYFKVWEYIRVTPSGKGTAQNWWVRAKILTDLPDNPVSKYIKIDVQRPGIKRKPRTGPAIPVTPAAPATPTAPASTGIIAKVEKLLEMGLPEAAEKKFLEKELMKADISTLDHLEQAQLYNMLHGKIDENILNSKLLED